MKLNALDQRGKGVGAFELGTKSPLILRGLLQSRRDQVADSGLLEDGGDRTLIRQATCCRVSDNGLKLRRRNTPTFNLV